MTTETLDQVFPTTRTVTAGGKPYTISPFKVKTLKQVTGSVAQLLASFEGREDIGVEELLLSNADEIIKLVAITIDEPVEVVGDFPWPEFAELATATVELNLSFFVHRVLPEVRKIKTTMSNLS